MITWLKYPVQEAFYVFCASTRKIKTEHTALGPICFQGSQLLIQYLVFNELSLFMWNTAKRSPYQQRTGVSISFSRMFTSWLVPIKMIIIKITLYPVKVESPLCVRKWFYSHCHGSDRTGVTRVHTQGSLNILNFYTSDFSL